MNRDAIFSDGTIRYRQPEEPAPGSDVTIRIRLDRHDFVTCIIVLDNGRRVPMYYDSQWGEFAFYQVTIPLTEKRIFYHFEIRCGSEYLFYDRFGVTDDYRPQYRFSIMPGFSTPAWARGAVMYQILVDRFCNSDADNDVLDDEYHYISMHSKRVKDWNTNPSSFDVACFYGGDLQGVYDKLDYLKSLGIEVIYFNPLFVSPSNHKYDAQDYDYIDPHYGKIVVDDGELLAEDDHDNRHATRYIRRTTDRRNLDASNEFFAKLVAAAHERGMKVILDGVFNHCGSFNKWLDRERIYEGQEGYAPGAYVSGDSPYREFFHFYEQDQWPYNHTYDGWWGHDTLPKLNYEGSTDLTNYILRIGAKWVSPPYNVDGWRLDVAADLGHSEEYNHRFWQAFRAMVKKANPNAVILAEHYGDASSWLEGTQWDTIMNYDAFMEPISFFLTGMEKHSDRIDESAIGDGKRFEVTMLHCMTAFMTPSLHIAMNELSNHDHSRFLTRTNHKVGRVDQLGSEAAGKDINVPLFKLGVMMQMTWPGAPTVYYGDEAGVVGFTDPDNRRTYPWDDPDRSLIDFHRDMIFIHKAHEALRTGSFMFLSAGRNYVSYARFTDLERIVVVINCGSEEMELSVPVWKAQVPFVGSMDQIMVSGEVGYSIMLIQHPVEQGMMNVKLKPYTGVVYSYKDV
ncbi:MAG: glycoside hydrolase family 13 protein [Lachnospiraceae bacterium]|nr:glycoside hydrolase family 13 protein [Lachnospiraceae bacterium]